MYIANCSNRALFNEIEKSEEYLSRFKDLCYINAARFRC
jgi:hypothetical protein